MRFRNWIAASFLALIAVAVPARAAEPAPTLLVRFKSIDGLMADAKHLAELAGQDEAFKQVEGILPAFLGPKGFDSTGLDTSRPWGLYSVLEPEIPNSPIVLMIPVADEKVFVESISRYAGLIPNVSVTIKKGDDGVYTITVPNPLGLGGYFVVDGGYAYITGGAENSKASISKSKRFAADKLLPADDKTTLGLTVRLDTIDATFKQIALSQFENQVAAAKERKSPNETPAQTKLREQTIDYLAGQVRSLLADGKAIDLQLTFDRKTDDVGAEFSLSAKPDSALARDIAALKDRFSRIVRMSGTSALAAINVAVPEALRPALASALDEGFKQEQGRQKDMVKKLMAQKVYNALAPTLKAGEFDVCAGFVGPNAAGRYTLVAGISLKNATEIEQVVRDLAPQIPDAKAREAISFDADTVGANIKVHKITPYGLDDDAKRLFGENATGRFAFSNNTLAAAFGADSLKAVTNMFISPVMSDSLIRLEGSVGQLAALDKNAESSAKKAASEAFGTNSKADLVRLTVEGGPALKVQVSAKALLVTFGAKMDAVKKGN